MKKLMTQLKPSLLVCRNYQVFVEQITLLTVFSLFILAPTRLYAEETTEFGFRAVTEPPPGNVSISHYEITVSGAGTTRSCRINSSLLLHCYFTGLFPMSKYTLTAKACSEVGCGSSLEVSTFTLPIRKLNPKLL